MPACQVGSKQGVHGCIVAAVCWHAAGRLPSTPVLPPMRGLPALLFAAELGKWVTSDGEGAGMLLPTPRQERVSLNKVGRTALACCSCWRNHSQSAGALVAASCPDAMPPSCLWLPQLAVGLRAMPHEATAAGLQMAAVNLAQRVA